MIVLEKEVHRIKSIKRKGNIKERNTLKK